MPSYHVHRRLALSLKNALLSLQAGVNDVNFTPDAVAVVRNWRQEYFNQGARDLVYLIRPGQANAVNHPSFHVEEEAEFFILGVKKHEQAPADPFTDAYVSETDVQDAMMFDVEKVLNADITREALSCKTFITDKTFELELDGFVVVEWRVLVEYEYLLSDPSNQ
jgi:hypothetical protein